MEKAPRHVIYRCTPFERQPDQLMPSNLAQLAHRHTPLLSLSRFDTARLPPLLAPCSPVTS